MSVAFRLRKASFFQEAAVSSGRFFRLWVGFGLKALEVRFLRAGMDAFRRRNAVKGLVMRVPGDLCASSGKCVRSGRFVCVQWEMCAFRPICVRPEENVCAQQNWTKKSPL